MKRIAWLTILALLPASSTIAAQLEYVSNPFNPAFSHRISAQTAGDSRTVVDGLDSNSFTSFAAVMSVGAPGDPITAVQAGLSRFQLRTFVQQATTGLFPAPVGLAQVSGVVTPTQDLPLLIEWDWVIDPDAPGEQAFIRIRDVTDFGSTGSAPIVFDINSESDPLSGSTTFDLDFGQTYYIELDTRLDSDKPLSRIVTSNVLVIPEPASLALLGLGGAALLVRRRSA